MSKVVTRLDYYNGENEVPAGSTRISASSFAKFFSSTTSWWRENLMNETGFTNSTSSVLGTCVHFVAEEYVRNNGVVDKEEIERYIAQFDEDTEDNWDIDTSIIRLQYPIMGMALVNMYLIENPPSAIEEFLYEEILPEIGVGGSCDNLTNDCVVDYKTFGGLTAPSTISYEYRLQLLMYAWLYTKKGIRINRIRIVYITRNNVGRISEKTLKPMKDYPTTVSVITEEITQKDLDFIESLIFLTSDSVDAWNKMPEFRYIIAQDYRLKHHLWNGLSNTIHPFPTANS